MARKTIAVDFDGVIHSYTSGWQGPAGVGDAPVPGALGFLRRAINDPRFDVVIYSTRAESEEGYEAIDRYLMHRVGLTDEEVDCIVISAAKPKAVVYIDDRGWCFEGFFPDLDAIDAFKPWNKR